jgi:hypothetical protein
MPPVDRRVLHRAILSNSPAGIVRDTDQEYDSHARLGKSCANRAIELHTIPLTCVFCDVHPVSGRAVERPDVYIVEFLSFRFFVKRDSIETLYRLFALSLTVNGPLYLSRLNSSCIS